MENELKKWLCECNTYHNCCGNALGLGTIYGTGNSFYDRTYDFMESYGDGKGYASGSGSGYGTGTSDDDCLFGIGIKKYNQYEIFRIDSIPTIITKLRGNIAKGFILNKDLTLEPTFVVKSNNYFSHGSTIKEAMHNLEEKILENRDLEEIIEEFKNKFNKKDKYKGTLFYQWHHYLTGSCVQGRNDFVKNNGIDLEKEYTVLEFLQIVKNAYGWSNLEQLVDYYQEAQK